MEENIKTLPGLRCQINESGPHPRLLVPANTRRFVRRKPVRFWLMRRIVIEYSNWLSVLPGITRCFCVSTSRVCVRTRPEYRMLSLSPESVIGLARLRYTAGRLWPGQIWLRQ